MNSYNRLSNRVKVLEYIIKNRKLLSLLRKNYAESNKKSITKLVLERCVAHLERLLLVENKLNIESIVYEIYDKYSDYDYADMDVSNYRIKSIKEFNTLKGGVCWDFVIPIANNLDVNEVPYTCYFTGLHNDGNMIASHTYIVTDTSPRYWIECSWMRNKGVHEVSSFKDVENVLKSSYSADEVFTVSYVPRKTQGMKPEQFFNYLEDTGIEC